MASIKRTVHSATAKTSDIEIHVSTLETDVGTYTDIREFVVSLQEYGRGITFPNRVTTDVLTGLGEVKVELVHA